MPPFRFKLDPVLDQRQRHERDQQVVVARLEAQRLELENKLREQQSFIVGSKDAMRAAMGGAQGGTVNPSLLRQQATNTLHLNFRAHQTVLNLAGLHRKLEAERAELAERAKKRRAIELLKERRQEEHRRERERKERTELDEIATSRAARRADNEP
jgi:flagellar protein FliJ